MRRRLIHGTFAAILALAAAGPAWAGAYEEGLSAYERGDFATAVELWRPLAHRGDAEAEAGMGLLFSTGEGVAQDYKEAARWLRSAADKGDVNGLRTLGHLYRLGQGVDKDDAKAANYYGLAAQQGDPEAQNSLGLMFAQGLGVPRNFVEAYTWFALAAAGHSPENAAAIASAEQNREKAAGELTPAQLAEARKRVKEWRPRDWATLNAR
jgi:TPR repeat protein